MKQEKKGGIAGTSRRAEEAYLAGTLEVIRNNVEEYGREVARMKEDIDVMLEHFHDNDTEVLTLLNNTITMHDHMKRALERNEKAMKKPYFGRIVFHDETLNKEESLYIGRGGISEDTTHWKVIDWRAPVANAYYENGLGKCSYLAPGGVPIKIDLQLKRTYEIENEKLLDYFDTEVIANDELLTKYLAKNKQAVLGEIIATIQKEQNDIIRKSPYHNVIVQGVAGSGKTTVAMHRISYILYNYQERFAPEDFYIVGSNRILLEYITGVLPDLDVYGIRQMTMEQLFVRLLYEDWDERRYRIADVGTAGTQGVFRGTLDYFLELQRFCERLEWETIRRETVYLDPLQFVEGLRDGKPGVFDERKGKKTNPAALVRLVEREAVERYIRQNPTISIQSKIDMLNERLLTKIKEEFLIKGVNYTEAEQKAILKAYRGWYGPKKWKKSIYELYRDFLAEQAKKGMSVEFPENAFDVYDLAALAYLYSRVKETEVISEAHHVVIDEAQDFGMMAYAALHFCIKGCTYTVMGDVSQNIHFGYGLNDWEALKRLLLSTPRDSFGVLKKSYRNTVEISEFATNILHHGSFSHYPVEPIIRHGSPVALKQAKSAETLWKEAAAVCKGWQEKGYDTIAVVCRDEKKAAQAAEKLSAYIAVQESSLEKAVFTSGIMVFPVAYTKGLEFDAVLILDPTREEYPTDDGHAKLLYVAATRALHELCVLHNGSLTGLIADPLPKRKPGMSMNRGGMVQAAAGQSAVQKSAAGSLGGRKNVVIVRNEAAAAQQKPTAPQRPVIPQKASALQPDRAAKTASIRPAMGQSAALPAAQPTVRERQKRDLFAFGGMPPTDRLRPAGHGKIDMAVRWISKEKDGLYLQSRYGILRLSPVGSGIVRITFSRGLSVTDRVHPKIAVDRIEKAWSYKDTGKAVLLQTEELLLQVDKATGAIRYMTRDKQLLLAERAKESRQLEQAAGLCGRNWLFLDWQKGETLYGLGLQGRPSIRLRGSARYISGGDTGELPFLFSEKGYGILVASLNPVICCDLPAYGAYLATENEAQQDYYFIGGKRQTTILNAYGYLCGKI